MAADLAALQGDGPAALRHAVRATKCLPGDLAACSRAAQIWKDPAVKALWRRPGPHAETGVPAGEGAAAAAEGAAAARHCAPWAEKEALEDDAAHAMLYIEEAQRLARAKKAA